MKTITKIRLLNSLKLFNPLRSLYYRLQILDPKILAFYRRFIKKNDLCFDIGANVGRKTDIFLKLGARVIAVEPQPECIHFLQKKYRFQKMVTVVGKAADSDIGKKDIYLSEVNSLSSLSLDWIKSTQLSGRYDGITWGKQIKVETTTLDELIKIYGQPHFCKIDVEGYELSVLKGLTRSIATISFELAPESISMIESCILYLSFLGRARFNLSAGEDSRKFNYEHWMTRQEMIEKIRSLPETARYGEIYASFSNPNALYSREASL